MARLLLGSLGFLPLAYGPKAWLMRIGESHCMATGAPSVSKKPHEGSQARSQLQARSPGPSRSLTRPYLSFTPNKVALKQVTRKGPGRSRISSHIPHLGPPGAPVPTLGREERAGQALQEGEPFSWGLRSPCRATTLLNASS